MSVGGASIAEHIPPATAAAVLRRILAGLATPGRLLGMLWPLGMALGLRAAASGDHDAETLWLAVAWWCVHLVPSGLGPTSTSPVLRPSAHLPVPHRLWLTEVVVRHAVATALTTAMSVAWAGLLGASLPLVLAIGWAVIVAHALIDVYGLGFELPGLPARRWLPLAGSGAGAMLLAMVAWVLVRDSRTALGGLAVLLSVALVGRVLTSTSRAWVGT